jgi:hypothetical protein
MKVVWIIVAVVAFLILVYVLSLIFSGTTTLSTYATATAPTTIPAKSITDATALNYGYSIWIYIENWSYAYGGAPKPIFSRGSNPIVSLGSIDNTLTTAIALSDDTTATCVVPNIPLQKWTNVIVTVNDKSLDTYLNGKLVKTCVLTAPPATVPANTDVKLTPNGGFAGFTARFKYWGSAVNPQQAWNVYRQGPGGNLLTSFFNQYRIQLNFLKGNTTQASITI